METLSLQSYTLPEFSRAAPREWESHVREISPVTAGLSHLRFRWRTPSPDWLYDARGVWELYSCTPRAVVGADRARQFERHWSELPATEQVGRRAMVSNYQHYMWHTHGVEARRFWVLQGPWGGTPAVYTRREQRMLDACGAVSEPFPLGFFPPCDFTERAVQLILERDRLVQAGTRFDALEKLDRPDVLRAEDEAAERAFRARWLDTWFERMQPQAEFMKSALGKAQLADASLPPAPEGLADALAGWQDQYIEHGNVPGSALPQSKQVQVAVR